MNILVVLVDMTLSTLILILVYFLRYQTGGNSTYIFLKMFNELTLFIKRETRFCIRTPWFMFISGVLTPLYVTLFSK